MPSHTQDATRTNDIRMRAVRPLLTPALLKACDFDRLDDSKNWFDVTISHDSLAAGLHNYLFCSLPVVHRPHGSRPWKQLKYTNPIKYYWTKWTKGFDKI